MFETHSYWDKYYAGKKVTNFLLPSQFAVFVLGELSQPSVIYDIGCGRGRDALFFTQAGHTVFGVDSSSIAVRKCTFFSACNCRG